VEKSNQPDTAKLPPEFINLSVSYRFRLPEFHDVQRPDPLKSLL